MKKPPAIPPAPELVEAVLQAICGFSCFYPACKCNDVYRFERREEAVRAIAAYETVKGKRPDQAHAPAGEEAAQIN